MMLTAARLAYLAGVIDARGHVEVNFRHDKPQPRVRVTTARRALLDDLAAATGSKVVIDGRGYTRRACGEHCTDRHQHVVRQSAQWTVDSCRATILLYGLRPFIVAQAAEVDAALAAGLAAYPAARGDTAKRMAALGWELPVRAVETGMVGT